MTKLNSKLSMEGVVRLFPDLVDKYEAACNKADDIQHEIDGLLAQVFQLKALLATARSVETRAWNRMIRAANKTVED